MRRSVRLSDRLARWLVDAAGQHDCTTPDPARRASMDALKGL